MLAEALSPIFFYTLFGFMLRFAGVVAADLAPDNINVNVIAPGFFPSKMTSHLLPHEEELAKGIPRGRIGTAEDAAGTAIYLCSRASAWVTGNVLLLDGGHVTAT